MTVKKPTYTPEPQSASWKNHALALGLGALLGVAGTSLYASHELNDAKQEAAEVRSRLKSSLGKNEDLQNEVKTLKAQEAQAYRDMRFLRDENEKMSKWMKYLLKQEEDRMKGMEELQACNSDNGNNTKPEDLLRGFELTPGDKERIAEMIKKGCRVDSVVDGQVTFESMTTCGKTFVTLENKPTKDFYSRDVFEKGVSQADEELLSLLEERKYDEVLKKVPIESLREDVTQSLVKSGAPDGAIKSFQGFFEYAEKSRQSPADFAAQCALIKSMVELDNQSGNFDPGAIFKDNVTLIALLEALDKTALGMSDENMEKCADLMGESK